MLEGDTAAEVEGLFSNTGKCSMFETKKEMRIYLYNWAKNEKREKERDISIFDEKTKEWVSVSLFDLKNGNKEKAKELARNAKLEKA